MLLSSIWLPSLAYGFCSMDFVLVPVTLAQFLDNPFSGIGALAAPLLPYNGEGRPVGTLTFALLPSDAFVQHAVSLLVFLTCLWLMWRACRHFGLAAWPTFLALSSLFHPAFLWNVTWIAHRYDLLVVAFLLLAIVETRTPLKIALIALCSGAKPPLFVQNVVFAWQFARDRRLVATGVTLLWMVLFGIGIVLTRYVDESQAVAGGDSALAAPFIVSIPIRALKMVEGMLYVFAPIPMFAVRPWVPFAVLAIYVVCWTVLFRSLKPFNALSRGSNWWMPWMALALAVPFLFASEVRIVGPAAVATFLSIAAVHQENRVRWSTARRMAVVAMLALDVTGILLNYGVSRSAQYDISGETVGCGVEPHPVDAFASSREELRLRLLTAFGIRAESRSF